SIALIMVIPECPVIMVVDHNNMKPAFAGFINSNIPFMKSFFMSLVIFLLLLSSCSTMKWKKKYAAEKFFVFQKKYFRNNQLIINLPRQKDTLENKSFGALKRKQFKRNIYLFEKGLALVPDSTSMNGEKIDSFYKNPYKIDFIKKEK